MPPQLEHLFDIFDELSASRGMTLAGPARLTHLDLFGWQFNHGTRLLPREVEALIRLDGLFCRVWHETQTATPQPPPAPTPRQRPTRNA